MTATHFRGSDGEIKIDGNVVTVVEFNVDITTSVIASPRVGKVADKKYAGKQDITGSITQVLVTPDLLSKVIGDSDSLTTSTLETLLTAEDLSGNAWTEYAIGSDPSNPTSVKCTLTVGTDDDITAGSIVIRGTNSSDQIVTEVIDFAAMAVGDAAQVKYGSQQFETTDYVDVSGNLHDDAATYPTLKIEGITGTKTMTPGNATIFDIIGKVEDSNNNYAQLTCNNCFFTAGNFPIVDSNTLVSCDLPFVVQDADEDVTLVWTST